MAKLHSYFLFDHCLPVVFLLHFLKTNIVIHSFITEKNVLKAIELGATSYIVKPVSKNSLTRNMNKILGWLEKRKCHAFDTLTKWEGGVGQNWRW